MKQAKRKVLSPIFLQVELELPFMTYMTIQSEEIHNSSICIDIYNNPIIKERKVLRCPRPTCSLLVVVPIPSVGDSLAPLQTRQRRQLLFRGCISIQIRQQTVALLERETALASISESIFDFRNIIMRFIQVSIAIATLATTSHAFSFVPTRTNPIVAIPRAGQHNKYNKNMIDMNEIMCALYLKQYFFCFLYIKLKYQMKKHFFVMNQKEHFLVYFALKNIQFPFLICVSC